jgi:hypothetical protein
MHIYFKIYNYGKTEFKRNRSFDKSGVQVKIRLF